jgi:DNA repair protein SbcC/Rad50
LLGEEEAVSRLAGELSRVAIERDSEQRRAGRLQREHRAGARREEALGEAEQAATEQSAHRGALAAEVAVLTARLAACAERDSLTAAARTARQQLREAVDAAQQARQDWLDLQQARLEGIAAELAAELVVGCGCPVCGSPEHPRPAADGGRGVTEHHETAARRAHQAAETVREVAEARASALRADLAAARARAGGDTPAGEVAAALDERSRALEHADTAGQLLGRLRDERAVLAIRLRRLGSEQASAAARVAALDAEGAQLCAQRERRLIAVEQARGEDPSLADRRLRLLAAAAAAERYVEGLAVLGRAEHAVEVAQDAAERACGEAGFPTMAAALAAVRTPEVLQRLVDEQDRLAAEAAAAADCLADPRLVAAGAAPAADAEAAESAVASARAALTTAVAAHTQAVDTCSALRRLQLALADALSTLGPLREQHRLVDGLSHLVEGTGADNAKRMRLSSYVLAARLEQVAAAASERLVRMSAGRYTLVHTDEGNGRGRAGLGLRVVDAWTGEERETTTLSGGESFFASLALALGLADVVAAEAGGARIETLFVDEGFGSLDEDTLEDVMDVLDGLRSGGRVVGVVSHVAELRQRIPAQLHVLKQPSGSHLRVVLG